MCMLFEDKKKRYKLLLIFVIPLIVLLLIFGFLTFSSISSLMGQSITGSKNTNDIVEYDYHLRSNATDYQKELFKELSELIKSDADDLEIVECVAKNYVADAYTWDNKQGQWDVGGMCYVHSPSKIQIYQSHKDTFYGLLNKYQDEYGKTGLLEVSNVEVISSSKATDLYEYDGNMYEHFNIQCDIEYTESSRFAKSVANRIYLDVIKNNDGRFEIVICYGNEY